MDSHFWLQVKAWTSPEYIAEGGAECVAWAENRCGRPTTLGLFIQRTVEASL